ncbi:MAG: DUF2975 domain-containing protein [Clostridia bacterium]|nr:DUF2975 domain-containing protein [Clostridia bacterium]
MWNREKSLILSKMFIWIFLALLIGFVLYANVIVDNFVQYSRVELNAVKPFFVWTIYVGSIPAVVLLLSMQKLLKCIEVGDVFTVLSVKYLRIISWTCFVGAIIALIGTTYYLPWLFVAIAAAFMGLVVRILKNTFAQAVVLKEEADFTI